MKRAFILLFMVFSLVAATATAAELKNEVARQEGNRLVISYDLEGSEKEAEVSLTIIVGGQSFKASDLHIEGDVGKVKPGTGKRIYWNVLRDFPKGLSAEAEWELSTTGDGDIEMVFVKGGCYQMGDTFGDGYSNEMPVHEVCLDDFYMGKYEVTQGQWKKIMGNNPSRFNNCGDKCPVENISWNDAHEFIRRLNSQSGKRYRLPTEAEWEYAARSGGKSAKWSGTSSEVSLGEYAWFQSNSGGRAHPIGRKKPNGLGLYNMSGNVWEWCSDWYSDKYYSQSSRNNPGGPSYGSARVLRGGSWNYGPRSVRAANRDRDNPDYRNNFTGFRLALPPGHQ